MAGEGGRDGVYGLSDHCQNVCDVGYRQTLDLVCFILFHFT